LWFFRPYSLLQLPEERDLSGKWEVQMEGYGAGKFGESKVAGTVKDSAVEFEMRVIENEHIITVHYAGVASDEGIKGTVTFGDVGKGTWVASRPQAANKK
jgi:hypothetical protein